MFHRPTEIGCPVCRQELSIYGGTRPAYLIFDIDIIDRNGFDEYVNLAKPTLAAFGAKILAIADAPDV
jgi:hypothetical protein